MESDVKEEVKSPKKQKDQKELKRSQTGDEDLFDQESSEDDIIAVDFISSTYR
mgnify:CR=1 FL=1